MVTISKQEVSALILLEEYAKLHSTLSKISNFENKYEMSFTDLELKMTTKEDFEAYDDYIEWKALLKNKEFIANKIDQIKNGDFQIS
jgi:hypothetical protein